MVEGKALGWCGALDDIWRVPGRSGGGYSAGRAAARQAPGQRSSCDKSSEIETHAQYQTLWITRLFYQCCVVLVK